MSSSRLTSLRSCALCRQRKTRCELPEASLELTPSDAPLPAKSACHRCQVLSVPCILSAYQRRPKRPRVAQDDSSSSLTEGNETPPVPAGRQLASGRQSTASSPNTGSSEHLLSTGTSHQNVQGHTSGVSGTAPGGVTLSRTAAPESRGGLLDPSVKISLVTFEPELHTPEAVRDEPCLGNLSVVEASSSQLTNPRANSMMYHGRPLELTKVMIGSSFRCNVRRRRSRRTSFYSESSGDTEATCQLVESIRPGLETGYRQLCTFIPHLPSLAETLAIARNRPDLPATTLCKVCLYLSVLSLPTDPHLSGFRSTLLRQLQLLIPRLMVDHPASILALQVFDMLAVFAPLGLLPGQSPLHADLTVTRGYVAIARSIASQCNLQARVSSMHIGDMSAMWSSREVWLWLSLSATEAAFGLEDSTPRQPPHLAECAGMARVLSGYAIHPGMSSTLQADDCVLAKVALLERLKRFEIVYQTLDRMYHALETSCSTPFTNAPEEVAKTQTDAMTAFETLDDEVDECMDTLHLASHRGWTVNRNVRRLFDVGRLQRIAIRYLFASAYLPGSTTAFDDVPASASMLFPGPGATRENVEYAIRRASNPADVARFFKKDPNSPVADTVAVWVNSRSDRLEELLVQFAELDFSSLASVSSPTTTEASNDKLEPELSLPFAPWQGLIAVALDACNVIFEIQAAHLVVTRAAKRLKRYYRPSQRLYIMRCAADKIAMLEHSTPDADAECFESASSFPLGYGRNLLAAHRANSRSQAAEDKTLGVMCSEMIKEMVFTAERRITSLQKESSVIDRRNSAKSAGSTSGGKVASTTSNHAGEINGDSREAVAAFGEVPETQSGLLADWFGAPTAFSVVENNHRGLEVSSSALSAEDDLWSQLLNAFNPMSDTATDTIEGYLGDTRPEDLRAVGSTAAIATAWATTKATEGGGESGWLTENTHVLSAPLDPFVDSNLLNQWPAAMTESDDVEGKWDWNWTM